MSQKYPFLDLLGKKLDDAQSLALETKENAVIAAGAGSGKTQVLATRFSWLVLTGQAKADQILTLTFTKKAASEMYQRIYDTLNFYAQSKPSSQLNEEQIQRAKEGLSDFANAHIQTLDSYCSLIVRECANRYGVRPDFSVGSGDGEREVKNLALKFTLQNAENIGIKTFAEPGKLQEFAEKTLAGVINKHTSLSSPDNFFTSKIPVQLEEITKTLNFYIQEERFESSDFVFTKTISKVQDQAEEYFNVDRNPKSHYGYKTVIERAFSYFGDNIRGIKIESENIINNDQIIAKLSENLEEFKKLILAKPETGSAYQAVQKECITPLKNNLFPILDSIFGYIRQFKALSSLYSLLDKFLFQVNSSKRLSGNLSFNDVSELALKILTENKDIRENEIAAYKKIMIDEFQDNNCKNRDLLYLISLEPGQEISAKESLYSQIIQKDQNGNIIKDLRQKGKLFFVGDEKQSIYKFRGAEVSVFNELTSCNENALIPMTYNYRSKAQTIKAFNSLFANGQGIFLNPEENEKDYEAYYKQDALKFNVEERREEILPELTEENVPIHLVFVNENEIKENDSLEKNPLKKYIPKEEQAGYFIALKIKELAGQKKNWDDFAILDKSRSNRSSITKYLSMMDIPYQLDQFKNIFEDGIVNDFYNFFRLCVYPSDINAYAAYLACPLVSLSQNSIELILSHLTNIEDYDFVFNPFSDFDKEIQNDLSESEFSKYLEARNFLKENQTLVLQQKLTDSLNLLWHKRAYKYESLLTAQTKLNAEQFDMLFELARQSDDEGKTPSWFIDQLEILKKSMNSEDSDIDAAQVSYPLERSSAVQIMTIHKSKGLQFKHVFICGCTGVRRKSDKNSYFFNENTGVSFKTEKGLPDYFCLRQKEEAADKETAEFRRLIYVGITRAIEDIYITGSWTVNDDKKDKSESELHIFENYVKKLYGSVTDHQKKYENGNPFDFVNLSPVSYEEAAKSDKNKTLDQIRDERLSQITEGYKKAKTLLYESNAIQRSCPSDLEKESGGEWSEDILMDRNLRENAEEQSLRQTNFTAADFGTLVHSYLEALMCGINPEEYSPMEKLLKGLDQKEAEKQKAECIKFTNLFAKTPEGKEAQNAKNQGRFFRAEWKFKMFWQEKLWTGSIDLIYQKEDSTYQIIDYKSDNKIDQNKYSGQQMCYKMAASKMLNTPPQNIRCKLWFMKENKMIDLD